VTIQYALYEVENKLYQADKACQWQSAIGALIIAVDKLKMVVESVIRLHGIDAEQPIDAGEKVLDISGDSV
jgi:hypothetical protein